MRPQIFLIVLIFTSIAFSSPNRSNKTLTRGKRGVFLIPLAPIIWGGVALSAGATAAAVGHAIKVHRQEEEERVRHCWGGPYVENGDNSRMEQCSGSREGQHCELKCQKGYERNREQVLCTSSGWDDSQAKCEIQPVCKNHEGNPVDWFVIYKEPQELSETASSYLYIQNGFPNWNFYNGRFNLPDGAPPMRETLAALQDPTVIFASYSDEPPGGMDHDPRKAHAKGVLAKGTRTGFFLSHTLPNFPSVFPKADPTLPIIHWKNQNGQVFLCMSFNAETEWDHLMNHVRALRPHVYNERNFGVLLPPPPIAEDSYLNTVTTLQGTATFRLIAKSEQAVRTPRDLYRDIIRPRCVYNAPLDVAAWRRGAGGKLPSDCQGLRRIEDVNSVRNPINQRTWTMTTDHSKWTVTQPGYVSVWCIADMNRYESQMRRYGGAVCLSGSVLTGIFRNMVQNTECNNRNL